MPPTSPLTQLVAAPHLHDALHGQRSSSPLAAFTTPRVLTPLCLVKEEGNQRESRMRQGLPIGCGEAILDRTCSLC
jgi:hypothetical protein